MTKEWIVVGDMIAKGVGEALRDTDPKARAAVEINARSGVVASGYVKLMAKAEREKVVIISTGSFDTEAARLERNVRFIRERMVDCHVAWILPRDGKMAATIAFVADDFGDVTVDLKRFATDDGVQPVKYESLAASVVRAISKRA